jgi:MFS family permease
MLESLFALSHCYLLFLLLIAAVGFAQITFSATANTTLQTVTPDHLRGRVMSLYILVFAGTMPVGNLFTRGLALLFGIPRIPSGGWAERHSSRHRMGSACSSREEPGSLIAHRVMR